VGKFLVLILVGVVLYLGWKALSRRSRSARDRARPGDVERMVGCRQCGVHLPVSEAIEAGDNYFCSEEHRRMFVR
jgi:uncharacterized protein